MKPVFEKLFGFDSKQHNVRTEILAVLFICKYIFI